MRYLLFFLLSFPAYGSVWQVTTQSDHKYWDGNISATFETQGEEITNFTINWYVWTFTTTPGPDDWPMGVDKHFLAPDHFIIQGVISPFASAYFEIFTNGPIADGVTLSPETRFTGFYGENIPIYSGVVTEVKSTAVAVPEPAIWLWIPIAALALKLRHRRYRQPSRAGLASRE